MQLNARSQSAEDTTRVFTAQRSVLSRRVTVDLRHLRIHGKLEQFLPAAGEHADTTDECRLQM